MKVTEIVTQFAKPVVEAHGCQLWDVEYVREGSERFLRLYLDKEGGVDINDCEAISRAIDPILDEKKFPASSVAMKTAASPWKPVRKPLHLKNRSWLWCGSG